MKSVAILALVALALVWSGATVEGREEKHRLFVPWYPEDSFHWFNLTWKDGAGGLTGGGEAGNDEGPPDPNSAETYANAKTAREAGIELGPSPHSVTFESRRLPWTLVLNATRPIHVELYLKAGDGTTPCAIVVDEPGLGLRLFLDGRLIGGTNSVTNLYQFVGHKKPQAPPGYTICRYSLGTEAAILPAGSVLRFEVTFIEQDTSYVLGVGGDHRSVLKLPSLAWSEAIFRYPELAPVEDFPESNGPEPDASAAMVAGWATAAWAARRRRTLFVAAMASLLTLPLAGCLGSKQAAEPTAAEGLQGEAEQTFVPGGELVAQGTGSIVGRVRDDQHVPIPGVYVAVLGTARFTQADGRGRFQVLNLAPGPYRLRFDMAEYRSYEADLVVKEAQVSRTEVTLYLVDPAQRDARPHAHDYWPAGEESVTLYNAPLPNRCSGGGCWPAYDFQLPFQPDRFATILPGTTEVQVTLDWEPAQLGHTELGLAVSHNGDPRATNSTVYAPRARGVPFRIATTWEMTDPGHQTTSSWTFHWFEADPKGPDVTCLPPCVYLPDPNAPPGSTGPTIQATFVVKKGALPLEPGHPDLWQGATQVTILSNAEGSVQGWNQAVPPSVGSCRTAWDCRALHFEPIRPTRLVPPGATWIELTIRQARDTNPHFNYLFYYKPANMHLNQDPHSVAGWKTVAAQPGATWEKTVYRVPVTSEEADFLYARRSDWRFSLEADDFDAEWADRWFGDGNLCVAVACFTTLRVFRDSPNQEFTFDAKVFRTPMPG